MSLLAGERLGLLDGRAGTTHHGRLYATVRNFNPSAPFLGGYFVSDLFITRPANMYITMNTMSR